VLVCAEGGGAGGMSRRHAPTLWPILSVQTRTVCGSVTLLQLRTRTVRGSYVADADYLRTRNVQIRTPLVNMHRLIESVYFQDGGQDVTLHRKVLPSGECAHSICPAHMQQHPHSYLLTFKSQNISNIFYATVENETQKYLLSRQLMPAQPVVH